MPENKRPYGSPGAGYNHPPVKVIPNDPQPTLCRSSSQQQETSRRGEVSTRNLAVNGNRTGVPGGAGGSLEEALSNDPGAVIFSLSDGGRRYGGRRFSARRRSWPGGRSGGKCIRCNREFPFEAFAVDRSKASGRSSFCRECDRVRSRDYYAANRERVRAEAAKRRVPKPRFCSCGEPTHSPKSPYCESCSEAAAVRRTFRKRVSP